MKELNKHKRERKTLWQWLMEPSPLAHMTFKERLFYREPPRPCKCQRKRKG